MRNESQVSPENTAARVALWRALHVEVDSAPHVFEDKVGLELLAPGNEWRQRPDMASFTKPFRASIVGRARFVEDCVEKELAHGVDQYVILGAGLDTFAQRRKDISSRIKIYEVDRPGPQQWKQDRLKELGYGIPPNLRFVPVDFESGELWWNKLEAQGFDRKRPAVVASTGVSMYLSVQSNFETLRQLAAFAGGSTFVMSFMLPIEMADPEIRPGIERAIAGAKANGTPFVSFFKPEEVVRLAHDAGFKTVRHVSATELGKLYFSKRTDGLRPPAHAEEIVVCAV